MTALEQVEQLTQHAIAILLAERATIDARLRQFGHGQKEAPAKRRGRPPLNQTSHSGTTDVAGSVSSSSVSSESQDHPR